MRTIDLTKNGGFPLTQDALAFMQTSYTEAFAAIAACYGNKTIITGMEVAAGVVADGWFVYNGEIIKFNSSNQDTKISISTKFSNVEFNDGLSKSVYAIKTGVCAATGAFNFSELQRIASFTAAKQTQLDNTWQAGDIKMISCDNAYIATNFDSTGLGRLARAGWAICNGDNGTANMRGRVAIGYDSNTINPNNNVWDAAYNTMGSVGGEKKHKLTSEESGLPAHNHPNTTREANTGGGTLAIGSGGNSGSANTGDNAAVDAAESHENRQPFIVTLFIQKL